MPEHERVRFVARNDEHNLGDTLASPMPELSVVVPAFNEAFRLPVLLESLRHHVDPSTEIIVVDDGSTDDTAAVAQRAGQWAEHLQVVEHDINRGKGAAVRTGIAASRGRLVAFVDADNATDLAALAPMCDRIAGRVGAVFGSRHAPGAVVTGSPPVRGVMGRVFNHVVRLAAGTSISDTQCGAKVFRGSVARTVFAELAIDGFAFDVEVLRRVVALGLDVVEHPVNWHYVPGTKITLLTPLRMLRDIARIRMRSAGHSIGHVDCTYAPVVAALADRLDDIGTVVADAPVRIFVPAGAGFNPTALQNKLAAAGLVGTVGQSRT